MTMTVDRIRGRKLQAIRNRVLKNHPICQGCGQRGSVEVDHIKPLYKGGSDDPHDDSNRQALCLVCHEAKTKKDLNRRPVIGLDGYPVE